MQAHKCLPVVADADHFKSLTEYDSPTLNPDERTSITGTAQDISSVLDVPEDNTRTVLIYFERQESAAVRSIIHDGTRRWYEVNPRVDRGPPSSTEIKERANIDTDDLELQPGAEVGPPGDNK